MGQTSLLPERPSGRGGLLEVLPGQGRAHSERENAAFQELQSEPAELKCRNGAEGRAAAAARRCKAALFSLTSLQTCCMRNCLWAGQGKGWPRSAPLPTEG